MSENNNENLDQGFNDSELEDIMNEIESLEKEFSEDSSVTDTSIADVQMEAQEDLAIETPAQNGLQDLIDREVESIESELGNSMDAEIAAAADSFVDEMEMTETETEAELESNVVALEPKKSTPTLAATTSLTSSSSTSASDMSVQLSGQMNMAMTFPMGESQAQFSIQDGALCVEMNGLNLTISETEGCTVTMENGVKFTIPLTTSSTHSKKSAA